MLGANESRCWQKMRKGLLKVEPRLWLTRIETGSTAGGVPDVHVHHPHTGLESWIELKAVRAGQKVHLSGRQVKWHEDKWRYRGMSWIAVFAGDNVLRMYAGEDARKLKDGGLPTKPYLMLEAPFDWSRVEELLATGGDLT